MVNWSAVAFNLYPHGYCLSWQPHLLWLHAVSDLVTAVAYFTIPAMLLLLVRRRQDLQFSWMFVLFGVFILACGGTHVMNLWTLWRPDYLAAGVLKAITALASVGTAAMLIPLLPKAVALPGPAQWEAVHQSLRREIGERKEAEDEVLRLNRELELRVQELHAQIADRKRLEGQLVQSEKLASLGQLTAGVAHEINNPMGYVFSNFGTLEDYFGKLMAMLAAYEEAEGTLAASGEAARLESLRAELELDYLKEDIPELMEQSMQGIARVRQIVLDLKDFSRANTAEPWQRSSLHHGIDSTLNIIASEIRYSADVVKHYGELPDIECQPSHLNQVIMNLLVNAAHAIGPQRGTITIRTGHQAGQVWLEVADTGAGIAPDILPRIFDPFFTTKPVGKGTGLGLSIAYGVVQRHHGSIEARSEPGHGTCFRIVLPVRQPHAQALAPT